jgi:glycosylphosphatidylinositol phospholipase D
MLCITARTFLQAGQILSSSGDSGFPAAFDLSLLLAANGGNGSRGFAINGANYSELSGTAVRGAGDVNGDGLADLIVGAPQASPNAQYCGAAYIVFGRSTHFPAEFDLAKLRSAQGGNGSKGFVINGIDSSDKAGIAVDGIGDINGDGLADVAVATQQADLPWHGASAVYVVFGRSQMPAEIEARSLTQAGGGDGSAGFVANGADTGRLL